MLSYNGIPVFNNTRYIFFLVICRNNNIQTIHLCLQVNALKKFLNLRDGEPPGVVAGAV